MARVVFTSSLLRYTGGTRDVEVDATSYRELAALLSKRFPELTGAVIDRYAVAIDGRVIQTPMLEQLGADSELVFVAKIAGG